MPPCGTKIVASRREASTLGVLHARLARQGFARHLILFEAGFAPSSSPLRKGTSDPIERVYRQAEAGPAACRRPCFILHTILLSTQFYSGMVGTASAGMGQPYPAAVLSTFRRVALVDGAYFTAVYPYIQRFYKYLSVILHI